VEPGEADSSPARDSPASAELRQIIQPVENIAQAVDFYSRAFGLHVRFVDDDRFAALDAGGAVLALAAGEENLAGHSAPAFKVTDLDGFLASFSAAGGTTLRGPEVGPHERRVVVADPWGNRIVVYASS